MKRRELQELRTKAEKEIIDLIAKRSKDLNPARLKIKGGEAKNVREVRNIKRELAQMKTILREKSL